MDRALIFVIHNAIQPNLLNGEEMKHVSFSEIHKILLIQGLYSFLNEQYL